MSNYHRITRECPPDQLSPELRQALQAYIEQHALGTFEDFLMCCETVSEKKPANWLGKLLSDEPDQRYVTALALTPQWLLWARHGEKTGTTVSAAMLKDIAVWPITTNLTHDTGLEVGGFVEGFRGRMRGYIALGPEPVARQFCDLAVETVKKAHPTKPRAIFGIPWPRRRR